MSIGADPKNSPVCGIVTKALDGAAALMQQIKTKCDYSKRRGLEDILGNVTDLDLLLQDYRFSSFDLLKRDFNDLKEELQESNTPGGSSRAAQQSGAATLEKFSRLRQSAADDTEFVLTKLSDFVLFLRDLATDVQISLPDMVIQMFANKTLVGFARVPVKKVT